MESLKHLEKSKLNSTDKIHSHPSVEILPKDFISFIDQNYERIQDIREKIIEFHNKSLKNNTNRNLVRAFSVSSYCERDESNIIKANVVPKFVQRSDTIQLESSYLETSNRDPISENNEDLQHILQQFPLVSLSVESAKSSLSGEEDELFIRGYPKQFSLRATIGNNNKMLSNMNRGRIYASVPCRKKLSLHPIQTRRKTFSSPILNSVVPSINEIALDLYKKYVFKSKSNMGISLNSKQLTLPPLHSSVLTLLGQKSPYSGIPGQNEIIPSKQRKLRRHGRRRTSKTSETREHRSEGRESENRESAPRDIQESDPTSENTSIKKFEPLSEILDDNLTRKTSWYRTREKLDNEIDTLRQNLTQNTSKLRANGIGIKEDTWLSYPRTWSICSATFSCPLSASELKQMTPMEYLTKYVEISQPRQDLYSLVFKRYLTMENPLGKTITVQTAKKALTEILGRSLSSNEKSELFNKSLGINSDELELSELQFKGICAFCERMLGDYSLDESKECYVCWKYPKTNKNRCHRKTQNLIELADLELIKKKIQTNQVNPLLANLFLAL